MVLMEKELKKAMAFRDQGNLKESNILLLKLIQKFPNDAYLNYQCACSYDVLGEESNAVAYYENAIIFGLSGKNLDGALLGLGSTYRILGEYEKSKNTLLKGMELLF